MENGKVALVPHLSNALGFGSTEFHVLRGEHDIEPRWLAHYIAQAQFRRLARQNMTGSAGQMATLHKLGQAQGMLGAIFFKAQNKIQDPAKLSRLVQLIDAESWVGMDADIKGDLYEGWLQKKC